MGLRNIKNSKEAMRILYQNETANCNIEVTIKNIDNIFDLSEKTDSDNSDVEIPKIHLLNNSETIIFLNSSFTIRTNN